mmetsp:Transcript_20900/g.51218  ORF Transcript_20900/g.51218 Transcript_20900/m.51218 type:complete len:219 (+) Transcript_20900:1395-2051(+)
MICRQPIHMHGIAKHVRLRITYPSRVQPILPLALAALFCSPWVAVPPPPPVVLSLPTPTPQSSNSSLGPWLSARCWGKKRMARTTFMAGRTAERAIICLGESTARFTLRWHGYKPIEMRIAAIFPEKRAIVAILCMREASSLLLSMCSTNVAPTRTSDRSSHIVRMKEATKIPACVRTNAAVIRYRPHASRFAVATHGFRLGPWREQNGSRTWSESQA